MGDARRLSASRKLSLSGEVLRTYAKVRRVQRHPDIRNSLATLREWAAQHPPARAARDARPAQLAGAVTRTLDAIPVNALCLQRAMVLATMLSRRGLAGKVVIGVRPGGEFGAHAWVELDDLVLLPEGGSEFPRLVEL